MLASWAQIYAEREKVDDIAGIEEPDYSDLDIAIVDNDYSTIREYSDGKRVAVDVTAWMTSKIRYSDVTNPNQGIYYRIHNISSKESRAEIRHVFNVNNNKEYEIWHVVSFISDSQRDQVIKEYLKYVNRVIEFSDIMRDLVNYIKQKPNVTQETETLHTIRALVLCDLI